MTEKEVLLQNADGLHARPATVFVQTAGKFTSDVQLVKGVQAVDAKSILGVLSLGITKGTELTIRATGVDEAEAVNTLVELIQNGLGEAQQ